MEKALAKRTASPEKVIAPIASGYVFGRVKVYFTIFILYYTI